MSMEDDWDDGEEHYDPEVWDEELAERLQLNEQAWNLLIEKGYIPGEETKLDFVFVSEKRTNAQKFQAFLQANTDYSVKFINNDHEFELDCRTSEVSLSLEWLNEWVSRLVKEGRKYECTFDGWVAPALLKKKSDA